MSVALGALDALARGGGDNAAKSSLSSAVSLESELLLMLLFSSLPASPAAPATAAGAGPAADADAEAEGAEAAPMPGRLAKEDLDRQRL